MVQRWTEEEAVQAAAVKVDGVALVLFYMPVSGSKVAAVEEAREEVLAAVVWVGSDSGNN